MSRLEKLRTYARLGVDNIARVGFYRLGLETGLHPALRLQAKAATGPFFKQIERSPDTVAANTTWDKSIWRFGWHQAPIGDCPPDWFENPFSDVEQPDASLPWWEIPDFSVGDIKGVWELSRFNWVIAWATQAANGDKKALKRLNDWLADWAQSNPPYMGPNWKCGQETSIRVMHLVVAAWILGQLKTPTPGLVSLLVAHMQRIEPTISYAVGQQNNHGTSEAAALFVGGSFLFDYDRRAETWMCKGRELLEDRARRLIEADGSFSQYSVVYHRLMLDSYSLADAWRRAARLPAFSRQLQGKLVAATRWLEAMTEPVYGDTPNIGANDGAHILQLTESDYRDFRPSVQLAAALFESRDVFGEGPWNSQLRWLGVPEGSPGAKTQSTSFNDGGYHVLRAGKTTAYLRFPRFRFRPGQADALHVDLWHEGKNLLSDAGTFSYNSHGSEWFAGTSAHNTVEFDGRDQMPRLGRFLFGDWLRAEAVEVVETGDSKVSASAAYSDMRGAQHHRRLMLTSDSLICEDNVSGNFCEAVLRWRLASGDWSVKGNVASSSDVTISVEVDGNPAALKLCNTRVSCYYLQEDEIPCIFLAVDQPATLTTTINF